MLPIFHYSFHRNTSKHNHEGLPTSDEGLTRVQLYGLPAGAGHTSPLLRVAGVRKCGLLLVQRHSWGFWGLPSNLNLFAAQT